MPIKSVRLPKRDSRRGMLLIVILALLVLLAVIGIAFGYLVSSEKRSSQNALDRFRAMSAARDGEAFAVAHLREIATYRHYEGEGTWSFNANMTPDGRKINQKGESESHDEFLRRYSRNTLLGSNAPEQIVSLSRGHSSNSNKERDRNWVDANGNGNVDAGERNLGRDLVGGNDMGQSPLDRVSYIVGDGIDMRMLTTTVTSGTYRELGDRSRLKVIDTNSQLNINDYEGEQLIYMLTVLGQELALLDRSIPNPFTPEIAREIVIYKEAMPGGLVSSKAALRPFFDNEWLYQFTMDFIAVHSWPLDDSGIDGVQPNYIGARNPDLRQKATNDPNLPAADIDTTPYRKKAYGFQSGGSSAGEDGNPEQLPGGFRRAISSININTVTKPVLAAILAGIEAEARFFYFPQIENVTTFDAWVPGVRQMRKGTTDFGRQPLINSIGVYQEQELAFDNPGGVENLAIYQAIPVGPLGHVVTPPWKNVQDVNESVATRAPWRGNHASALANAIIQNRKRGGPYRSWMDFDQRICKRLLLGIGKGQLGENCADLVNTNRSSRMEPLPTTFAYYPSGDGGEANGYLPDPSGIASHPASGRNSSSSHSYNAQEFDAWYWRASVDMIRAALNPNGYLNKFNPDAAYYTTVDSTDLRYATAPICFNSCGVYEIISQGEVVREQLSLAQTNSQDVVVARRTFRSVVEVYRVLEHTTQEDFLKAVLPPLGSQTSAGGVKAGDSKVTHDLQGTQTWPHSIDHSKFNYADKFPASEKQVVQRADGLENLVGGYFTPGAADNGFGWVSLKPLDRTPNPETKSETLLNFHLKGSCSLDASNTVGRGNLDAEAHRPFSLGTVSSLSDMWNSASPDPARVDATETGSGFASAASPSSSDAARYATLRPDGVLLRGWHLNPMFRQGGSFSERTTYSERAEDRMSRLALLRYRAGAISNNPFSSIAGQNPDASDEIDQGGDPVNALVRLVGEPDADPPGENGNQGTDEQNKVLQSSRQFETNFPYYEGWIDFWIKWDLPPQGVTEKIASAGEIDPGSGNFSGLIGACSFGRFGVEPYDSMGPDTDFEGSEFFVFKEPGGVLRISHIYFTQAWKVTDFQPLEGTGYSIPIGWEQFGNRYRISGKNTAGAESDGQQQMALDEYTATNDIASGPDDLGFSYARTDSYVNLSELPASSGIDLITHNWYRMSIKYISNHRTEGEAKADPPHTVYIDGRPLPVQFEAPSPADEDSTLNTGELTEADSGAEASYNYPKAGSPQRDIDANRRSTMLLEVTPEDRLTIGCISRRQSPRVLEEIEQSNNTENLPLFRFDTNLVAPANATLDDVRITGNTSGQGTTGYGEQDYVNNSRYDRRTIPSEDSYYENGFLATRKPSTFEYYSFPVRLGTFSWTEYRPSWDSYASKRTDLANKTLAQAPQTTFALTLVDDISQGGPLGGITKPTGTFNSVERISENYWLEGGVSLERLFQERVYLRNLINDTGSSKVSMLRYRAHFICPDDQNFRVLNASPILDDVRLTMLTPPRRIVTEEILQ